MSPYLGEFLGTFILIVFGGGVVAGHVLKDSKAFGSGWVVITLAWGLGVTLAIYAVGSVSGAHINPAVTLAFVISGDLSPAMAPGYMLSQIAGGATGGALVWLHYLPHWEKTEDKNAKLAVFSTIPAISRPFSNLLSEVFGTFVLIWALLFIGANQFTEGLNPLVVGALIVAIGMSLGGTTGYAINPARDLGPRLAHFLLPIAGKGSSQWHYSWIPILGPLLGAAFGATFYMAIFEDAYSMALPISAFLVGINIALALWENKKYRQKELPNKK